MRTKDKMLKDALVARNGYAYLKNSEDALPVRLAQDVTELLEEIELLKQQITARNERVKELDERLKYA